MKRIFTLTALLCLFMMMSINAAVAQSFSAKWSYGTNGDTTPTISPSGIFESSAPALGSSMYYKNGKPSSAFQTLGDIKVWQYSTTVSPADAINNDYTDDRTIKYTLTPKSGTTLTPSQISFYACKIATGDEVKIKVVASVGSKSVTLNNGSSSDIALDRDNGSNFKYDLGVSGLTVDNSNPLVITVYVKGKGFRATETDSNGNSISAKYFGFGEVTISGTYKAGSTSIKSSSEMTKSTTVPTTWDFSDKSKWSSTVKALNTCTSEWTATGSNEWRPTTVCNNREYNLELINGLVFNTNVSGDLCLDNSNKQLSVAKGSSITIPGLSSGNYVRFTGSISGITTPENATLISSDGSYLYKINSNGDVKFEIPSTIKDWGVWIKTIEVLASAPANKNASRQLSVEKLDYVGNINSKNNGLDRTTRGLSLDLDGGDGLKYDGNTLNWRYNKAAITFGVDPESIKSSGSDAKIKKFVISTNTKQTDINVTKSDLKLNVPGTIDFVDTYGTGPTAGTGFFIVVTPDDPVESLTVTLNKDVLASDDTKTSAIAITNFYVDYTCDNGIDLPDNPTTVLPEANENTMVIALNGNSSATGTAPVPNTSVNNLGGTHNSKNVWSYTVTTADGKTTSDVKISGSKVTASKAGEYILTANYTPTASNYFTWGATADNKETIKLRVIDQAVKSMVWIFDKTLANSDNKGIGNGQTFSSDLWSDTKVTDLDDKTKTYFAKSFKRTLINDDEPITVDGSTPVYRTDGLRFTTSLTDNLVVIPDHGLRIDENGAIVIRDVMPTVTKTDKTEVPTYILIDARPIEGRAGFKVDRGNPNCDFYNELFTSSTSRQTFMLKVDQSNANAIDVTLFPSSDMEIYKIEVTQKKVPVITPTVTGAGTDTENYTVNNKDQFSVKFNVEGGAKGTVNAYSISQVATGDAVSSTNGEVTFNGLAANGGDAVIVAQFVPSSDENTYTYGLSTVVINVSDKTMYRAKKGDQPKVGDWVTVPGIKMQFGGWEGAEGAPAGYRSDGTADKWGEAKKEAYIDTYPGFDYTFSANENSACETQWQYMNPNFSESSGVPYWYDEKNIPNNPYMMPVFGGFLKFVPSKNGTLEVYIHQNGVICTITRKNGNQEFNPHMMHIRSYYIADETGKLYTDGVTAETLAKPNEIWNGSNGKEGLSTGYGKSSNDPDDKTNYETDIPFYKKDYEYFKEKYDSAAPSTAQEIYNLQGGWVMLNEGASKYSFHVTAGKTYFVFTNRTKLGFYGFRFTPDENVTEVTITPSAEDATSYTLKKSSEPAEGSSVAYKVASFKRELNAGMWNTLCLPFSLNEEQTKAALPEGFEIVDFYSVKNDKLTFKKHYYQMIDAGRPYLIWIPGTQGEKYDMKFPTGCVAYDDKTSGSSGLQPINVNGEDDSADKYVWTGTYQQMSLPKNAYFVAQNPDNGKTVIKQNVSGKSKTKGYRAYLVAASGVTPVKALSIDYDGVDEEVTTGIDDIMTDLTDPETTGKVYNLGGQLVSRNGLQSLPKGIYIMNGKKYVVK